MRTVLFVFIEGVRTPVLGPDVKDRHAGRRGVCLNVLAVLVRTQAPYPSCGVSAVCGKVQSLTHSAAIAKNLLIRILTVANVRASVLFRRRP